MQNTDDLPDGNNRMRSRKLSLQEFADGYSHVVLTFRPTEQFEKVKKTSLVFASERTSGRSEEGSAENFGDRDSSDFARPFFACAVSVLFGSYDK